MHRSKILGGLALASLMLVVLTGCPSVIANIVGASESVQQAVDSASAGDTIKIMGSHDEDLSVDKDNITITSEDGGEIDGDVTVDGNNVTIENISITGKLDTEPGSFNNLTLSNVTVGGWKNANLNGRFSCHDIAQKDEDIQPAIDNAPAGGSVCIAPFTHQEQLVINKDLSLVGINKPTIKAPSSLDSFSFTESTSDWEPVIFAFGGNNSGGNVTGGGVVKVNIKGLNVDGGEHTPPDRAAGILLRNVTSTGSITNNTVGNMAIGGKETFGIIVYGDSDVTISNNDVSKYDRGGIGCNGDLGPEPDPTCRITDNNVTGPGKTTAEGWAPNGIQIGGGATGSIKRNDVSANGWPGSDWSGSGIIIAGSPDVVVEENNVHNNEAGISSIGWDAFYSAGDPTTSMVIRNNTVEDNDFAITLQDSSLDTLIKGNAITNNGDGVSLAFFELGDSPTVDKVRANDITGNAVGADIDPDMPDGTVIDMEGNYWGSANGPEDPDNGDNGQGGEGTEVPSCSTSNPENEKNTDPSGDLGNPIEDRDTEALDYCPWEDSSVGVSGLGTGPEQQVSTKQQDPGDPAIVDPAE